MHIPQRFVAPLVVAFLLVPVGISFATELKQEVAILGAQLKSATSFIEQRSGK